MICPLGVTAGLLMASYPAPTFTYLGPRVYQLIFPTTMGRANDTGLGGQTTR